MLTGSQRAKSLKSRVAFEAAIEWHLKNAASNRKERQGNGQGDGNQYVRLMPRLRRNKGG